MSKWLGEGLTTKLGMFFLATATWLLVKTSGNFEEIITVPVQVVNIPNDRTFVHPLPEKAKVRFSGKGRDLISLRYFHHPRLLLDYQNFSSEELVSLKPEMIIIDPPLAIIPVEVMEPRRVNVRTERLLQKKVPVKVKLVGEPNPGWVLHSAQCEPDEVFIKGPSSQIEVLSEIETSPIALDGRKLIETKEIPLAIPQGGAVIAEPSRVLVKYRLERLTETVLEQIPIEVKGLPPNVRSVVEPSWGRVKLAGAASKVAELKPEQVKLWVNYQEVKGFPDRVRVYVDADTSLRVISLEPPSVKVAIRVE